MKVVPLKVIVLFLFVICVVALKTEHGQHYARGGSKRNTKQRPLQHRHNIPSGTRTLGINEHIVDTSTSRASFSFSPSSSSSSSSPSTSSITPSSFVATESQVRHHHRQRAHIMKMEAIMADPSWSLKKALVDVLVRGGNLLLGKTMTDKLVRSRLEYGFRINGLDSVTTTKVRSHEKEPKLSIDMGLPLPTAQSKAYKANSLLLTLPWVRENDILQASSPGNYMLLYPSASPSQMKDGEEKVETDANSDAASGSSPGSSFSPETDSDSTFNSQEHRTIDDDIIYNHLMIDMHHREVEARLTDEMLQGLDLREHANEEESFVLSQISIFSIKDKKVCGYKANIASSGDVMYGIGMVAGFTANVCKELQGRDNASPITRRTINLDGIGEFLAPIAISPSVEPICSIDANVWREGSHLYKLAMSACEMLPPRESQSYLIAKCTATNICTEAVTLTIEPSGEPFNYEGFAFLDAEIRASLVVPPLKTSSTPDSSRPSPETGEIQEEVMLSLVFEINAALQTHVDVFVVGGNNNPQRYGLAIDQAMLQESEYEGLFNLLKTSPSLSPPPSESSVHDAADLSQLKRGLLMECVLSNMAWGLELEHHEERQRTTKETSTRSRDTHDATIDPELSNIFKTAAMKESSLSICSAYSKDGNINAFSHCKHAANVCSSDFLSKKDRGIGFKQCLNLAITAPTPEFPLSMASAEETQVAVELLTDHFHRGMREIESVIKRKVPGFRGKTGKEWSERQRQRVEEGDLPVVLNSASPSTLYNARLGLLTENEIDCLEAALRFSWLFPPVLSTSKENRKAEVNELVFIKKEWRCNPNDSDLSSSTSQCAVMAGHCVTGKKGEAAAPCVGLSFSDCRSSSNKHICEWEWAAHADIYRIDESKPLIKLGFENVEQRLIGRMVNAGLNLLAVGGWKFWKVVCRKMVQALMSSAVTKVADLSLNPPSPPSSSMSRVHNNRPRWTWLDGLSPVTSAIDGIVAQLLTPHINSLTQNIDKMATSIAGPNHARYVANAATFFTGSPNQAISLKVNTRGLRYSYGTMHDASKLIIDDAIEDANDEIKSALFYQNICVYTIVSTLCNLCKLPNFIARTFPSLPGVIGMREKLQTNGDGNNEDGRNDYMGAPGDVGTIERGRLNNPPSSSSPSPVSPLSASSTEQDMASAIVTSLSLRTQNLLSSVYNALSRSSEYEVDTGGDGGDSDEDGEEEKEENYGENGDTNQKYYSLSSAFDVEVSLSEQRGSLEKHSEHVNGDMREYRQTDLQEGEYSLRVETLMSQSYATPPVQVLQRRLCDPLHPVLAAQSFSLPSTFSVNRVGSFQTGTLKLSLPEEMQYQSTPLSFLKRFYFRFVVEKTSFLGRVRVERMAGLVSVLDLYRQAKGNMRRMVKAGLQEMPGSTSVSLPIPFFKSEGFHGDFRNTAVLLVHSQLVRKLAASSKLSINHRAPVSGPDYQSLQQDGEGLLGRPLFANQRVYLTGTRITNLDGELKVALIQNPVLDPSKRPGVDRTHQFLFQLSNLQLDISTRAHVILSKVQPLVPNTGLIRMQCRVDEVQVLMEPALLPHSKGGMLYFNSKVVSKGEAHLKVVQGLQLIRSLFDLEAYVMEYLHKYYLSDKFFRQFFTMDSSDPESPAVNTAAILGKALMEEDARLKEGKEERGEEEDGINIELELGFDHIALGEDERQQIPQAISDLNKLLVGMGYMVRDKTYEDSN